MTKTKSEIELFHTIICDDIRTESSGKLLLIGVFPDGIVLHKAPSTLPLSIWMKFLNTRKNDLEMEVKIDGDSVDEVIKLSLIIKGDDGLSVDKSSHVIIEKLPIKMKGKGELLISYKIDGKKWKLARQVKVQYKPKD